MQFLATPVEGVVLVESDPAVDARGFFARLFDPQEFAANGISFAPLQTSLSHNLAALTLRGMHYLPSRRPSSCIARAAEFMTSRSISGIGVRPSAGGSAVN